MYVIRLLFIAVLDEITADYYQCISIFYHTCLSLIRFRMLVLVCAALLPASYSIPVDPSSMSSGQISPISFPSSPSAMTPSVNMQPTAVAVGGRVVEPVAFSAVRASDKSRKAQSKIYFDTTLSDIGFGWNPKSSEFICYYPGSYFFTFTAVSDSGSHFK